MFQDWKFWLFILSICQMGLMTYGFVIIKFNDLRHLGKDVSEIQKDVKEINSKINSMDKDLSVYGEKIKTLEKAID